MTPHEEVVAEERAAREQLRRMERARRAKSDKRRAAERNRGRRLREVEARMDALAEDYRHCDNQRGRAEIRRELRDLGEERIALRWPS